MPPFSHTKTIEMSLVTSVTNCLDGELVMIAAPNIAHQIVSDDLFWLLQNFVKKNKLGRMFSAPTDVVLSDTNVVQPDLTFVSKGRMSIVGRKNIRGAPDLVVEVLSSSRPERDLVRKRDIYARHGVGEYWIADPDARSIRVMVLEDGAYRGGGRVRSRRRHWLPAHWRVST